MRGTKLSTLLKMLKAELRISLDATNTANDELYIQLLNNKQQWFAASFDWPFLSREWEVETSARVFALPTTTTLGEADIQINLDRPFRVAVWDVDVWAELEYAIGPQDWTDYTEAEPWNPAYKYQLVDNAGVQSIEVWPSPSASQKFRIFGQRQIDVMEGPEDICDIDDLLLVLFVAAEELSARESQDARSKGSMAQQRLVQLRSQYPQNTERVVLGEEVRNTRPPLSIRIRPQPQP